MAKVHVYDHPLIQHKVTLARKKTTGTREFRDLVDEISMLMTYEITRDLPLEKVTIETPLGRSTHNRIAGKKLGIVPIMRAGLGMTNGMLKLIPTAKVGHVGVYRDHDTLEAIEYFVKLPTDIVEREFIVVDPMLATGASAISAIQSLKKRGAKAIKFMCLIAAPEGVKALQEVHPDIDIYIAVLDEKLNENSYIVPGLGDAGDRLFGTK